MKLTVHPRTGHTKGAAKKLRREGQIPAILYGQNKEGQSLSVDGDQFRQFLRGVKPGGLSNTVFQLAGPQGTVNAIVKEIQYHVTTYDVIHLDFLELKDDAKVIVRVPINCVRTAECAGVKVGGALRQLVRNMKVRCLPKDIPAEFNIDVANLGMKQSLRLKAIEFPPGVEPVTSVEEVAVHVTKG